MKRNEAYLLLTKYLTTPNLLKHSLACEVVMKAVYNHLYHNTPDYNDQTQEKWGITGLLHDIDYELAKNTNQLDRHGLLIFEKETNIPEDIAHGIKAHSYEITKVLPQSPMDWGIACVDQLTGLIIAATLMHPEKNLAAVTVDFVMNRFNTKSFAKGAKREPILLCQEKLGIPLELFVSIALSAMQSIHTELGL